MIDEIVSTHSPIVPEDEADQERWHEQALRYRLLTGRHIEDVRDEIQSMFAKEIAADLEINPDLSRNPFKLIYQQLNVAYLEPPDVRVEGLEDQADASSILTVKLWAQQRSTALLCLSLQESIVRLDFKHWLGAEEVSYRVVLPQTVVCHSMPGEPDVIGKCEELRYREGRFTWEVWDTRDPENPVFRIDEINEEGERVDATAKYAPELAGSYPYRNRDGEPIQPYVIYHAKCDSSRLWNYTTGMELARGSLRLAALQSHWCDSYLSASYPQKFAIDVSIQGGRSKEIGGSQVETIPVDRKSILVFKSNTPGGGSLGQFQASMDPLKGQEALTIFERSLATYAGLNPADLQVSSPQSGYAIVVSREGQRKATKLIEVSLRMSDQLLLSRAAQLSNFYLNTSIPEDPRAFLIEYRALKPTDQERKLKAEAIKTELDMGVLNKMQAVKMLHPELETDEQALEYILGQAQIKNDLQVLQEPDSPEPAEAAQEPAEAATLAQPEPETDNVQLTALNGAQVQAAQGIVQAVADGALPRASGVQMLTAFFNMPPASAEAIMGDVGQSFFSPTEPTQEG